MKKRDNMKILVIDTCHNSLKFTLYQMNNENIICHGLFERIGLENGLYTIYRGNEIITEEIIAFLVRRHEDGAAIHGLADPDSMMIRTVR